MATGILKVKGDKLCDEEGKSVILRGAALGGWMNMENFITGFPGSEQGHRAAMKRVLGEDKYNYFFDRWLEYFFGEADAEYYASLGLNCLRIPINYRHFEDDMNPRVLKIEGFKHLDRVIDICAKVGIYSILDLHALPGYQNGAWHSDNPGNQALLWEQKDYQDRTVWLWEQLAIHYQSNSWVAGYNLINEPADAEHVRLVRFYERLEKAIRRIDPNHILFLDGNTYSMDFSAFDSVLPNCVYSIHDYSVMGFPTGVPYTGAKEQNEQLRRQYQRKVEFHKKHGGLAVWNGEFGPVYANPKYEPDAEIINSQRYNLLGQQLKIYAEEQIGWSIWLYKDVGLQGMLFLSPDSAYMKLIAGFLEKKKRLNLDSWGKYPSEQIDRIMTPLREMIQRESPTAGDQYPPPWGLGRHVDTRILFSFLSESLQIEFAELFKDKSFEELDELAKSFRFDRCLQREGLNKIMADHAKTLL